MWLVGLVVAATSVTAIADEPKVNSAGASCDNRVVANPFRESCFCGEVYRFRDAKVVRCNDPQLSDIAGLKNFNNLEVLDLNHTQVTDLTPLKGLAHLKALHLRSTPLDLKQLYALTNLRFLDLGEFPCSPFECGDLAKALPHTSIQSMYGFKEGDSMPPAPPPHVGEITSLPINLPTDESEITSLPIDE